MRRTVLDLTNDPQFDNHEEIVLFEDDRTGLQALIAVHNTNLGPSLGGCRIFPYGSLEDAIHDVLRLSRGMTYKSALAGLPLGGGKAVIIADARKQKNPAMMEQFGAAVESMQGRYITAEDIGTVEDDMIAVARSTRHVTGLPELPHGTDGVSGNPSPVTAYGTFCAIKAALRHRLGHETMSGLTFAIQGLGAVGYALAKHIYESDGRLIVADVNKAALEKAQAEFGDRVQVVPPDQILFQPCDVLSPCAMGAVLNDTAIPGIHARIIAGAANNQLGSKRHDQMLKDRGILYAPDYAANSGGVTSVGYEYFWRTEQNPYKYPLTMDTMRAHVGKIHGTMLEIFDMAKAENIPTGEAADKLAEKIFRKA